MTRKSELNLWTRIAVDIEQNEFGAFFSVPRSELMILLHAVGTGAFDATDSATRYIMCHTLIWVDIGLVSCMSYQIKSLESLTCDYYCCINPKVQLSSYDLHALYNIGILNIHRIVHAILFMVEPIEIESLNLNKHHNLFEWFSKFLWTMFGCPNNCYQ